MCLFLNVVGKLYKIVHGCTTEEWIRIQPKYLFEKTTEDQKRRLLEKGYLSSIGLTPASLLEKLE